MIGPVVEIGKARLVSDVGVSRETLERLEEFVRLLTKWTQRINLVARSAHSDIWERHVLDSAQLFQLARDDDRKWLDLGSGGGFPGIVVAIMAAEQRPDMRITLVECDQRKSVFLQRAISELGLDCVVLAQRAEALPPQSADVVSARALAHLVDLAPVISMHLAPDGVALLPKGRRSDDELRAMLAQWSADVQKRPSMTDPSASILVLRRLQRV